MDEILKPVLDAHERIKPFIHRTPIMTSATLDTMTGAKVFLKCENLQKMGAFKFRGACNLIAQLPPEARARGVVAHSSGNHAQAVALAAKLHGIPAHIVMPLGASPVKLAATKGYGAAVVQCELNLSLMAKTSAELVEKTGGVLVHPYDDMRIIHGAGTAALELIQDIPGLDAVLAAVSGGGLLAGTALACAGSNPKVAAIGCEPKNADDAHRSFYSGVRITEAQPNTIADGLRGFLGQNNFPIIREHVRDIVTVTEEEIVEAMRFLWERTKLVVEPSGAVSLAALLFKHIDMKGSKVGVILSGGNVDMPHLQV